MRKKITDSQVKTYISLLEERGEAGLYKFIVGNGIVQFASGSKNPDVDLLEISDCFFSLYRSSGEYNYFVVGKILRRGAHTIYRKLLKSKNRPVNNKFLNIVKS